MANPLLLLLMHSNQRGRAHPRRRVTVPTAVPSTDALFIALRRMRSPIITLVSIFSVSSIGLTLIPGRDEAGQPVALSLFDAFYFISYMATTIGFGELGTFTSAQRMWVLVSIYAAVIGWAFAISKLLALLQDPAFRAALETQAFRRKVQRLREPFVIVVGYGQTGRAVCHDLDEAGRRAVVIDHDRAQLDRLAADALYADTPHLAADATLPGVLGLAGLAHPRCQGVLAITDDEQANLAIVMTATLLQPGMPVIARSRTRLVAEHMRDFAPGGVIDANDRYGDYVVLALHHPALYQLLTWLLSPARTPLPKSSGRLTSGRWVVCAEGAFEDELTADLRRAGQIVEHVDASSHPDVAGAAGFVAGTDADTLNIALAEHARRLAPDIFVAVRQDRSTNRPLLRAMGIDSVFTPTDLVATETIARVVTPVFWTFVEHAFEQDQQWAETLLDRITGLCGRYSPHRQIVSLSAREAPAAHRWAGRHGLVLRDLLRDPHDRDTPLAVVPLLLHRGEEVRFVPDLDTPLDIGDRLLLVGRSSGLAGLGQNLDYDDAIEYVTTGRRRPRTWVWRALTGGRSPATPNQLSNEH